MVALEKRNGVYIDVDNKHFNTYMVIYLWCLLTQVNDNVKLK